MPSKRVLIVDDALDFGRMLQATLATLDASLKVSVVPSAEEAILENTRTAPDLLVTDVRLPGMTGFELVRKIRTRHPNLKIIMVTGLREEGLDQKALSAGASKFFLKPVSITDFIEAAQELLGLQPAPVPGPEPVMPPPVVEHPEKASGSGVTEIITGLRSRLGAQVVLLADELGKVEARAGDFEDKSIENQSLPLWMSAMSAAEKVVRALPGSPAGSAQVYQTEGLQLIIAPVGGMVLVIGLKPGRSTLRAALAVEEALAVQKELLAAVAALLPARPAEVKAKTGPLVLPPEFLAVDHAVEAAAPTVKVEEEEEASLGDLESIFAKPAAALKGQDLDAFWDQAVSASSSEAGNPDALSYEQALKLGLAPEDHD